MQLLESQETLVTVANATELASAVVLGVVGNEISSQLQGSPLTREALCGLFMAKAQQTFINTTGGL